MINDLVRTLLPRTICTAIEGAIGFDPVADDFTPAMVADRSKFVNRTLEAVKDVSDASRRNLEGQIVIVAAHFTYRHIQPPPP